MPFVIVLKVSRYFGKDAYWFESICFDFSSLLVEKQSTIEGHVEFESSGFVKILNPLKV